MAEKLGQRLKEVKEFFEDIIKEIESDNHVVPLIASSRVLSQFDFFLLQNENDTISMAATNAQFEIDKNGCKIDIACKDLYITGEKLIKILEEFLMIVDKELPKEEQIDILEDKINEVEISQPKDVSKELQNMLRKNAREIARILVEK